jgi:hypothetical protein
MSATHIGLTALPEVVADCPVREVLDRVGDEWSVLVIAQRHVRRPGVPDQRLVQVVLVGERADRDGVPQEHPVRRLRLSCPGSAGSAALSLSGTVRS